jgi:hypothetical protein
MSLVMPGLIRATGDAAVTDLWRASDEAAAQDAAARRSIVRNAGLSGRDADFRLGKANDRPFVRQLDLGGT